MKKQRLLLIKFSLQHSHVGLLWRFSKFILGHLWWCTSSGIGVIWRALSKAMPQLERLLNSLELPFLRSPFNNIFLFFFFFLIIVVHFCIIQFFFHVETGGWADESSEGGVLLWPWTVTRRSSERHYLGWFFCWRAKFNLPCAQEHRVALDINMEDYVITLVFFYLLILYNNLKGRALVGR